MFFYGESVRQLCFLISFLLIEAINARNLFMINNTFFIKLIFIDLPDDNGNRQYLLKFKYFIIRSINNHNNLMFWI